jgi:hypothetical protein
MKFKDLLRLFGHRTWFDFEMIRLASGEAAECVHTEVYRWRRAGKLIELRRGLFVLAEPWRRQAAEGAELAEPIYPPSYLSGQWALGYWGLLPAAPGLEYSSASARPARVFTNSFGSYSYFTLPRDLLFGTTPIPGGAGLTQPKVQPLASAAPGAQRAEPAGPPANESLELFAVSACLPRVALPEKALLDLCFIEGGEWDAARFAGLGLSIGREESNPQAPGPGGVNAVAAPGIDPERFRLMAERSGRPRLIKAAKALEAI